MEDEFYVSTDIMKQKGQTCCACHSNFLRLDHIWLLAALYKLFLSRDSEVQVEHSSLMGYDTYVIGKARLVYEGTIILENVGNYPPTGTAYIPEDLSLKQHCSENQKFQMDSCY